MADLLKGGTATVTGAASGIGQATAVAFAREGVANLAIGDIAEAGLEETRDLAKKQNPDIKVLISHLDVSNEASVTDFYDKVIVQFGRIDFSANVAGYGGTAAPITETSEAEYDKLFAVNQRGIFLSHRAQLRQMLKQKPLDDFQSRGSIVNVTSLCATVAMPGLTAYSASKAGALGLTKVDAFDYGPDQIRVNSVSPGGILTPMLKSTLGAENVKIYSAATPLRRMGKPEDVANAIVWLSSPRAQYITGINLPIDGGLNLATGPP